MDDLRPPRRRGPTECQQQNLRLLSPDIVETGLAVIDRYLAFARKPHS